MRCLVLHVAVDTAGRRWRARGPPSHESRGTDARGGAEDGSPIPHTNERMLMRKLLRLTAIATALLAAVVFPAAANAQNAHLRNNVRPNPAFTDAGLTLIATASYAGLGNFDTQQNLSATANPTADCVNPGTGEHRPPGQNPAEVEVTGSTAVPASDIKNGNVTITTETSAPTTPIEGAPDCPNPKWTENITDLAFTSATITVFQDANGNGVFEAGELVLTVSCTFNSPTSNGPVPASNYSCTES